MQVKTNPSSIRRSLIGHPKKGEATKSVSNKITVLHRQKLLDDASLLEFEIFREFISARRKILGEQLRQLPKGCREEKRPMSYSIRSSSLRC